MEKIRYPHRGIVLCMFASGPDLREPLQAVPKFHADGGKLFSTVLYDGFILLADSFLIFGSLLKHLHAVFELSCQHAYFILNLSERILLFGHLTLDLFIHSIL